MPKFEGKVIEGSFDESYLVFGRSQSIYYCFVDCITDGERNRLYLDKEAMIVMRDELTAQINIIAEHNNRKRNAGLGGQSRQNAALHWRGRFRKRGNGAKRCMAINGVFYTWTTIRRFCGWSPSG